MNLKDFRNVLKHQHYDSQHLCHNIIRLTRPETFWGVLISYVNAPFKEYKANAL